ncbi:hypothetical protein AVEN_8526-1 [Araneus ventricosus]|uniref:Uncharacterized protein n=1 Tax=Araneus ventricosus TaxID=182803 RepID=A0A4Y2FQB1_ARAVE|nr:hypothetical protein AVEN_8526-1 [Araneus ventricosus]
MEERRMDIVWLLGEHQFYYKCQQTKLICFFYASPTNNSCSFPLTRNVVFIQHCPSSITTPSFGTDLNTKFQCPTQTSWKKGACVRPAYSFQPYSPRYPYPLRPLTLIPAWGFQIKSERPAPYSISSAKFKFPYFPVHFRLFSRFSCFRDQSLTQPEK